MKSVLITGVMLALTAVLAFLAYQKYHENESTQMAETAASVTPPPPPVLVPEEPQPSEEAKAQSAVEYPVDDKTTTQTTATDQALEESDPGILSRITSVFGETFKSLFNQGQIIERFVVTVENSMEDKPPPTERSLFKSLKGKFVASKKKNKEYLSEKNYARYKPYVSFIQGIDSAKLVGIYVEYYPLFQGFYKSFGTKKYFNDRLVKVIDHLLKTPTPKQPIELISMPRSYQYVNPRLEALSASQKILIRMGPKNAAIVKAKLKEIRGLITTLKKK